MSTKYFDLLNPEQKGQIKKASSQRLFKWLVDVGMSEDEAEKLTREQLIEAWAEALSTGKDVKKSAEAKGGLDVKYGYDPDVERERLEFEKEKWKLEIEKWKLEREDQLKREETESDLRRMELALKEKEIKQHDSVNEAKLFEIQRKEEKEKSVVYQAKLFGDALRGTMNKMPQDAVELLPYFRGVEQLFVDFGVDIKLRVHLLKPHLTEAARVLIARMEPSMATDYVQVKTMLLREFKLSPAVLLEKFSVIARKSDETFTLFANRLKSLLIYYVENREVDSFDMLIDLLVCDRVKATLPEGALRHVLGLETKSKGNWLRLPHLVESLDLYYDTHLGGGDKPRYVSTAVSGVNSFAKFGSKNAHQYSSTPKVGLSKDYGGREASNNSVSGTTTKRACYVCGSYNHLQNFHAKVANRLDSPSTAMKRVNVVNTNPPVTVSSVEGASVVGTVPEFSPETSSASGSSAACANSQNSVDTNIKAFVCDVAISDCDVKSNNDVCDVVTSNDGNLSILSDFSKLQFIDVYVSNDSNVSYQLSALNDGGAEVCLANSSALNALNLIKIGKVTLSGAIGGTVEADLVKVKVSMVDIPVGIEIVCAVCATATHPLILNSEVIHRLQKQRALYVSSVSRNPDDDRNDDNNDDACFDNHFVDDPIDKNVNGQGLVDDVTAVDDVMSNIADRSLTDEQVSDESLKGSFSLVKRKKGNLLFKNGILHRFDKISGQQVEQLVLPECRRKQALKLAHETFGAHMGIHSTCSRLRYNFWWPTITRDVKHFVNTCDRCARRARVTVYDRVPIKSIERSNIAFNHWFVDIAGPLFPNQKVEYNYCFVACDNNTRWPVAFALRSVNSKSIVECLLKIWSMFGVSQFVSMDNAAYNTSKLTTLLMDKMGCSPIFITPGHSAGNSLAERTIGTVKELIHKVAYDHQRSWWKFLDYVLWAMREVPHSSTGISPWQLALGFTPRGPCAILKEAWTGETELPPDLKSSVTDYLHELRDKLAIANEYANVHLANQQKIWVNRYNLRSRNKQFYDGQAVMILSPDSTTSRLWSRWRAPAKIISKQSDYSYLVEIDGARQIVHANKLRPYDVRVDALSCNSLLCLNGDYESTNAMINNCSIVFEDDSAFGPIQVIESNVANDNDVVLPSQKIDDSKLSHLTSARRVELLSVLDKYPECFSEIPGFCGQLEHEIIISPEFRPKRLKPYRVPEKLKTEVDKQIQELLELGFIHESKSPMASPLICVIKRDKSVRCVVDYRYLNVHTVPDALGPPDMQSVIQRIGRAKFITTFDGKSSYWTIPVKQEHQWLTAFTAGDQLYEWSRVPFGLRNSGSTFVRMLQKVLYPIREFAGSYVDDLATFSETWKSHLEHIEKTLQHVRRSGLTLNIKKSDFAKPEVKFCGCIVGSGKRRVDPDKLHAVLQLKRPETKTQVRSVLGLFGWFREYIPQYADWARPLTELTSKRVSNRIPWGVKEQNSFDKLKELLCTAAEQPLSIIDWNKPFNIHTDASDYMVAGILSQTGEDGNEYPTAFYSKKLSDTQRAWSTIEKEAFAVLEALNRFRSWIFGYKICVYSDHNPLSYLTETVPKSAKLLRWALALQNFDISFRYKAGKSNAMVAPDCLSRMGPDDDGVEQPSAE